MYIPLYHRAGGTTQTDDDAKLILASGELHGHEGRYEPVKVRAYRGPLPAAMWGIEFTTSVPPDRTALPSRPTWTGPRPGVKVEGDVAKISVTVTTIRFRDGSEYHQGEEVQP